MDCGDRVFQEGFVQFVPEPFDVFRVGGGFHPLQCVAGDGVEFLPGSVIHLLCRTLDGVRRFLGLGVSDIVLGGEEGGDGFLQVGYLRG